MFFWIIRKVLAINMETTKKKGLRPWRELSGLRKVLRVLWIFVLAALAATALLFGYLTATEFKPASKENLGVTSGTDAINKVDQGKELSILTWNIGYGALGDNADFFMDGGKSVKTADEKRVMENMKGIRGEVSAIDPDFAFFQEVDRDSHRSSGIDEARLIRNGRSNGDSTFAYNFRVKFIPYPVPPIGKVNSGILTSSDYKIQNSVRRQLYCPFKWPVSLGNLKRCLMVDRVKINGSSKELVLINLHLEAYDSGTGKIKQTKMLRDVMDKERAKGNYVIAGGDFNQCFSEADVAAFKQYPGTWKPGVLDYSQFKGYRLLMDNSDPSCRSLDRAFKGADPDKFQYYSIDGFIVSDNVTVNSVKTRNLSFKNSDHNPVVMKFVLN